MAISNSVGLPPPSGHHWIHPQQQQQVRVLPYTGIFKDATPVPYLHCDECLVGFNGGIGGDDAQSRDEAVVAAYANGWYIGKTLKVCLDCRKKITPDNVDETLLQNS